MPEVTVNVFQGVREQIPTTYQVVADTYQDVVTALINSGINSGQIYGLNGERIDYNAPIIMTSVNYVIPEGYPRDMTISVPKHGNLGVKVSNQGTFRDIYNQMVAQGFRKNGNITVAQRIIGLDTPISEVQIGNRDILAYNVPLPERVDIIIETPTGGPINITISPISTAGEILRLISPNDNSLKLGMVSKGAYDIHIYQNNEKVYDPNFQQYLYLVPTYETLFNAYKNAMRR